MDRHFLKGFSLVELAIVMGVVALLSTAVVPLAIRSVEIKAAEKTITEVTIIQAAAEKFYMDRKVWPTDLPQLQNSGYLSPLWSLLNPWKNPYKVSWVGKTFSVATDVPANLVPMLALRLPQSSVDRSTVTSVIGTGKGDLLAPGVIVAWAGRIVDIPPGWVLCDGTNGTPDLRERFIVGARQDENGIAKTGITGTFSQIGGTIKHNHNGATGSHVLTVNEVPPLQVTIPMFSPNQASPGDPTVQRGQNPADGSLKLSTNGGGQGHVHDIVEDFHLPPYYALAFIMKL